MPALININSCLLLRTQDHSSIIDTNNKAKYGTIFSIFTVTRAPSKHGKRLSIVTRYRVLLPSRYEMCCRSLAHKTLESSPQLSMQTSPHLAETMTANSVIVQIMSPFDVFFLEHESRSILNHSRNPEL